MVVLLFLSTLSFQGFSTSCTISGTVDASSSPCSAAVDTVFVTGTLAIDAALVFSYNMVMVVDGGSIDWTTNSTLTLTTTSKLLLVNGGSIIFTGTAGGACNSQKAIYFGTASSISCNGGGGAGNYSFAEVNAAGGASFGVPLPVTLIDFTGEKLKNNDVKLQWQTAQEINNSHFELESYSNGNFEKIATIPGNGNSNVLLDYSFTHISPKEQVLLYRLKQVDFDGKSEYFKVISISNIANVKQEVLVFPNPILKGNPIELKVANESNYKFRVITYTGEEVLAGVSNGEKSIIETQSVPAGVYLIEFVFSNDTKSYEKVVIL